MAIALACTALLGWALDIPWLTGFGAGLSTLKPNTAVCFIAMAVSLRLIRDPNHGARRGWVALLLAFLVATLAALTVVEHVLGTSFVIDRWLFPEQVGSGRMGFNTSVAFLLVALALPFLRPNEPRPNALGQWLTLASGWFSLVTLLGYLHSLRLGSVSSYTEMSVPTTTAFAFLTLGALCARPAHGPMHLTTSRYAGGTVFRRILPAVLIAPVLMGWAVLEGSRAAWYPSALNLPLLSAVTLAILTLFVCGTALALDRKDAERAGIAVALERSEAEYRDLFQNVPAPVFQSSPNGRFKNVNRALVNLLGFGSSDELLAIDLADVGLTVQALDHLGGSAGSRTGDLKNLEVELKRRDGSALTALVNARIVTDEDHRLVYHEGALTDISERKRLEVQLRQTQKMEAIGRLAGGVAHDFNNTLTAIMGYANILHEELPPGGELHDGAEEILQAARRAAGLTRQLLAFSRQQVLEPEVLNLSEVVSSLAPMLQRIIGEHFVLEIRSAKDLDPVEADRGQIEQVVMNLVINARDAMPTGGAILIEIDNVTLDSHYAASHVETPAGEYVLLSVTDTGVGMDEETRAQIFEPFFTTKGQGRGTGLGLATVHGIVKQMAGSIWVYSEPGRGTSFKIYLPRTASAPRDAKAEASGRVRTTGSETVLIVEDEAPVRSLIVRILKRAGYTVLEAGDPNEALALAAERGTAVDLVVTDIVMPSSSGPELVERLQAEGTKLRVLYISGYANAAVIRDGQIGVDVPFLQKPFSAGALRARVREVLDSREP